ncbi:hypothetical protein [Nocardia sp. NPDC003345]
MPTRRPVNRAMAATLRLLEPYEHTDPAILERVASGLRAISDPLPPARETTVARTPSRTGTPHRPTRDTGPGSGRR